MKPGRRWSSVQTVPRGAQLDTQTLCRAWVYLLLGTEAWPESNDEAPPSQAGMVPREESWRDQRVETRAHTAHTQASLSGLGWGKKERAVEVASCLGELRLLVARSPTCSDDGRPVDVYFPTTVTLSREMSSNSTIGVLPTSRLATASPGRTEVEGCHLVAMVCRVVTPLALQQESSTQWRTDSMRWWAIFSEANTTARSLSLPNRRKGGIRGPKGPGQQTRETGFLGRERSSINGAGITTSGSTRSYFWSSADTLTSRCESNRLHPARKQHSLPHHDMSCELVTSR